MVETHKKYVLLKINMNLPFLPIPLPPLTSPSLNRLELILKLLKTITQPTNQAASDPSSNFHQIITWLNQS